MILVTPYDARSRRMARLLRLVLLLSLGTIFVLAYWAIVAFLTLRRGNRLRISGESASGDSRLKDILAKAYPEGVSDQDYPALLAFLSSRLPADTVARTVAGPAGKEVASVLADLGQPQPADGAETVSEKLNPHGFDDWVRRYA